MEQVIKDLFVPGHVWLRGLPQRLKEFTYGGALKDRVTVRDVLLVGLVILALLVFFIVPLVKSLSCGSQATSMGLTGYAWFVLILLFPFLGVFYFIFGSCRAADFMQDSAAAPIYMVPADSI